MEMFTETMCFSMVSISNALLVDGNEFGYVTGLILNLKSDRRASDAETFAQINGDPPPQFETIASMVSLSPSRINSIVTFPGPHQLIETFVCPANKYGQGECIMTLEISSKERKGKAERARF